MTPMYIMTNCFIITLKLSSSHVFNKLYLLLKRRLFSTFGNIWPDLLLLEKNY